jgi:RNA polymerase sigma-70 factor (ECF subfamily)
MTEMLSDLSAGEAPRSGEVALRADDAAGNLLIAVASGSRVAFRLLYAEVGDLVYSVLFRLLGSAPDAEDALQEAFIRLWTKAHRYDPAQGRGKSWVVSVARNLALDILRRNDQRCETCPDISLEDLVSDAPSAECRMAQREDRDRLAMCLDLLGKNRAEVIRLAFLEGLSYDQISQAIGAPRNTIKTWVRRSLHSLRECMAE